VELEKVSNSKTLSFVVGSLSVVVVVVVVVAG
jgi:hypothetical protein